VSITKQWARHLLRFVVVSEGQLHLHLHPASGVTANIGGLSFLPEFDPVEALRLIFPGADPQVRQHTCTPIDFD